MAKIKTNPLVEHLSGSIGDLVFRRLKNRVIVLRRPDMSRRVLSEAQRRQVERFREATRYAKTALANSALRSLYEAAAKIKDKPANSLAATDYLKAPTIDSVDLSAYGGKPGDPITIRVSDVIEVASVSVTLCVNKARIEQGSAVLELGFWRYTASAHIDLANGSVTVEVTAVDHPGNKTSATFAK